MVILAALVFGALMGWGVARSGGAGAALDMAAICGGLWHRLGHRGRLRDHPASTGWSEPDVPPFFEALRRTGVPVSLREYLAFLEGMAAGLVTYDAEGFYYLARTAMVKDERHLDRFDRAFAESFRGAGGDHARAGAGGGGPAARTGWRSWPKST